MGNVHKWTDELASAAILQGDGQLMSWFVEKRREFAAECVETKKGGI